MGLYDYRITPITGYGSPAALDNATFGTAQRFDSLTPPPDATPRTVDVVRRPGLDFHGLRLSAKRSTPFTATGRLYTPTLADGVAARDRLRLFMPQSDDAAYYGVLLTYSDVVYGPFSVLSARAVGGFRRLLGGNGANLVIPGEPYFAWTYQVRLIERGLPE